MATSRRPPFSGWRMIALCFLAQNAAMGLAMGSFGPLLASNEQHFGVSRTAAAAGMSVLLVAIGLMSPLIGAMLQRISVRAAMFAGALLSAAGYAGLALFSSFALGLVMYAVIGTGLSLMAILGPVTLISRWFDKDRAKVLSVINLPAALSVSPYLVGELLPTIGRLSLLLGVGGIFLLLAPAMLLIVERPADLGQVPHGTAVAPAVEVASQASGLSTAQIFADVRFWLVALAVGTIAGTGSAFTVHAVAYGVETGMSLPMASAMLSTFAVSGFLGTLLFGWLTDRLGPPISLAITTFCQAILWWALLNVSGPSLFLIAGLLGVCVVPLLTVHGAAVGYLFDSATISRAMGLSFTIKLPFLFGFAPLMGLLYDQSGGYHLPFLANAATLAFGGLCSVLLIALSRKEGRLAAAA